MKYDLVMADPPWKYSDFGTAKLPYKFMETKDLQLLPIGDLLGNGLLLVWVTCPLLMGQQKQVLDYWAQKYKFHYRGCTFIWVKTTKDGKVIGSQGPRGTTTKPVGEFALAYSRKKRGRPLPIADETVGQQMLAPRGERHSEKPMEAFRRLDLMYPTAKKLELFGIGPAKPGWDIWGDEAENPIEWLCTSNA